MELKFIINLIFSILAFSLTIFSLWYKIDKNTEKKIETLNKGFSSQLVKAIEVGDEKRSRMYERIDAIKNAHKNDIDILRKDVQDSYVPARLCSIIHSQAEQTFKDIKLALGNLDEKLDKLLIK